MSSLKDRIEARLKQSENDESLPVICTSSFPKAPDLMFITEKGEHWLLPWKYLKASSLMPGDNCECLHLYFDTREVRVEGDRLKELLQPLAKREIASIKAYNSDYEHRTRADLPFVRKITVTEKGKL